MQIRNRIDVEEKLFDILSQEVSKVIFKEKFGLELELFEYTKNEISVNLRGEKLNNILKNINK